MDIYEFSQALRRQWKMLVIGFLALVAGVFAAVFEVSRVDGSFSLESRITPKYESSVEMVVVPAGLESLASRAVAGGSGAAAQVYAQMLSTPEAAGQVEETQGIELIDTLQANAADSFINVTAISDTPEGAAAGALGAFRWLERRLAEPPVLAQLPEDAEEQFGGPEEFLGSLLIDVDRLYATADPGLTLVIGNFQGDEVALSLQGAAGDVEPRLTYLMPASTLTLSVEREVGVTLDTVEVDVPQLPEIEEAPPPLVVAVEWGAVDFEEIEVDEEGLPVETDPENPPGAQIDPRRVSLRWEDSPGAVADNRISLLLITEDVTALETGQRRTPVMVLGLLGVGILVLLIFATTIHTWQMAKLEQRALRVRETAVTLEHGRPRLHRLAPPEPDPSSLSTRTDEKPESGRGHRSTSS